MLSDVKTRSWALFKYHVLIASSLLFTCLVYSLKTYVEGLPTTKGIVRRLKLKYPIHIVISVNLEKHK